MSKNQVFKFSIQIPKSPKPLQNKAPSHGRETLGLAKIQRQVFICADQAVARCYTKEARQESWEYLKK